VSAADLKRFSLFADVSEADLELLQELLETLSLVSGQQLFREEQEADGVLLLVSGALCCQSQEAGALGRLEPGATLGVSTLVVPGPRVMTCVAEEASTLLRLTPTAFHRFAEDAPRGAVRVLEAVLRELAGTLREGLAYPR